MGYAYARLGQTDKAMECIHKMQQRQIEDPDSVVDGDIMVVWWALGNKEKVLHYAHQCIEKRMLPFYYMEMPIMRGVENEPWYMDLRKKVGL